jgi:hypothetical protein
MTYNQWLDQIKSISVNSSEFELMIHLYPHHAQRLHAITMGICRDYHPELMSQLHPEISKAAE